MRRRPGATSRTAGRQRLHHVVDGIGAIGQEDGVGAVADGRNVVHGSLHLGAVERIAIERDHTVVQVTRTPRQTTLLIRARGAIADPAFQASDVTLEELVLAYMGQELPANLTMVGEDQ